MKFTIMDPSEVKAITGWSKVGPKFDGLKKGLACGYNFEVEKDGKIDFASCTFSTRTPDDLYNNDVDYYASFLEDMGCKPTGRVAFRGYYQAHGSIGGPYYTEIEV